MISDQEQAIEKAVELLENTNLKSEWQKKRRKVLNKKIDVTNFMTRFRKLSGKLSNNERKNQTRGV